MRAKKPQTRLTGGSLTKSLKPSTKKTTTAAATSTKQNTNIKSRSNNPSAKSVPSKKPSAKGTANNNSKPKDESENNEKKSKSMEQNERNAVDKVPSIGSNLSKEKPINRAKSKSKLEKKSSSSASASANTTTSTITSSNSTVNGEKKALPAKDEKIVKQNKELKNLDIQICGYSSVAAARESTGSDSDTDRVIKASICEIVKTKARAASATFNSSGNRSSPINSFGVKQSPTVSTPEKSPNKIETALKSIDTKSGDQSKKKKADAKTKTPAKPKAATKKAQTTEKPEKIKKNSNENKKPEANKMSNNKSQKAKTKASPNDVSKSISETTPVIPTEKQIEIKAQVDESKSLIDTITDAINEVVKQYKDGGNHEDAKTTTATGPNANAATKSPKKVNKIVKTTTKKKVLSEKKLDIIEAAGDLVAENKSAIKIVSKKAKAKSNLAKDNKTNHTDDDKKLSAEKAIGKKETSASAPKDASENIPKKVDDKINKSANKSQARAKSVKKQATTSEPKAEPKGSKIIKIDLKAKKKIKSSAVATGKAATKQTVPSSSSSLCKVNNEAKVSQSAEKKMNDEHKSEANGEEISDDDNLSLTELKAQLSKCDTKKSEPDAKANTNTIAASTKLVNTAGSCSANKQQKAMKSGGGSQKPAVSSVGLSQAKKNNKLTSQKETGTTTNSTANRSDVYDFEETKFGSGSSNNSGNAVDGTKTSSDNAGSVSCNIGSNADIPYVHKKKRGKISSNVTPPSSSNHSTADKVVDIKKSSEKSKTLPPKKQIRLDVLQELAKSTKSNTSNPSKASVKAGNRNTTDDDDTEKDEEVDKAANSSDTKKVSTKSNANSASHKLAAKNRRLKLFGFYSGPKRHRMASLNALAKVQCLYENESRTAQELGFVKEPQNVQRIKIVSEADKSDVNAPNKHAKEKEIAPEPDKKEKKPKKVGDIASACERERERQKDVTGSTGSNVAGNNRTLRKVPGVRGEGSMWEMENSSLDESEPEKKETVSWNLECFVFDRQIEAIQHG